MASRTHPALRLLRTSALAFILSFLCVYLPPQSQIPRIKSVLCRPVVSWCLLFRIIREGIWILAHAFRLTAIIRCPEKLAVFLLHSGLGVTLHRRDSTQGQIFSMSMIRSVGPLETTKAFHSADFPDGPLNLSGVLISPSRARSSNSTPPTTVPILRLLRRRSQQVPWPDRLFLFRCRPHRSV